MMEDEDEIIIRNRLIYKDLLIKKIFKKYLQLVNLVNSTSQNNDGSSGSSVESSDTLMSDSSSTTNIADIKTQVQQVYAQLLNEFSLFELSIQKAQTISETCKEESNYYAQLCKQREIEIENERKEIIKLKETLDYEKKQRQYKEQYLALYKAINEKPSIEQTEKEIQKSQKELNDLSDQTNKTTSKLELRTKQFQLLLHTLGELEKNLDDDFIDNTTTTAATTATIATDQQESNNSNNEDTDNNDVDEVMKEGDDDGDDGDYSERRERDN